MFFVVDNLKKPAAPLPIAQNAGGEIVDSSEWEGNTGFTKLEKAALMIAAGFAANANLKDDATLLPKLSKSAVVFAKAVLEEANK